MQPYFVGLDVHKQLIAFCVKTANGEIVAEGTIPATRAALNAWVQTVRGRGMEPWKLPCSVTGSTII
jgi:hypothetical protein